MTGKRRRICLFTESPDPSGVGAHMLALAEGLAADHDIIIGAPAQTRLIGQARERGFIVKTVAPADAGPLERWFAATRPDLLHIHAGIGWEGHATARAAHGKVGAVVRTEHLPYLLTDPAQQGQYRDGTVTIDSLICVSEAVAQSFREQVPDLAPITIPNGVTRRLPTRERAALRLTWHLGTGPVLLMAGRFTPQKGHALMLAAWPAILAAWPGATLLLAGDGPLLHDVAATIGASGLAGSVRVLGARGDLPDLMAVADLLVLPSQFEGLSLVALEAMAAGLPVVATDVAGNGELIEHEVSGWLTPPADASALSAATIAALRDRDRLASIADAARQRQGIKFTTERMVAGTRAIYDSAPDRRLNKEADVIRIGFIGTGGIAQRHFAVLEQFDDVTVSAVADIDASRADDAAARFGARAFNDLETMLNAVELDAVFVCVPPFAHGAPERACLARDLPMFIEKPVTLDLETAEDIGRQVAEKRLLTATGYHWRYLDMLDEVRDLLSRNPARLLSGYWLDSTPPPIWWWRQDRSGGQMIEQTTHLLDLARHLCGPVVRAYGLANHSERQDYPGLDVPTVSSASLLFESGAIANFASTCLLGWNHRVGLHLFADRLAIELTDHDVMIDVGRGRPVRGAQSDPVWQQDRDFIDAVSGGENRIRCPYAEALETHRLAHAVVQSARSGQPVPLAPVKAAAHV